MSSALSSAIGSTIQAYNANYVVDASYVHTDNNLTNALMSTYSGKQDALVSGTNIKTINGSSLLGSGGLTIDSGITTADTPIQGDILYYNGSAYKLLPAGTDGQFLKTQGESANPIWSTPAGAGDTLAPATNSDNYLPQWDGANSKTLKNGLSAGGASGVATLDANTLVVQDPANATATATASKIPIADGSGKLDTWLSDASDTAKGKVELATAAEVTIGTDTERAVTPDALAGSTIFGVRAIGIYAIEAATDVAVADGVAYLPPLPACFNGMNLISAKARVITAGTTNATTIDIYNLTDSVDMLSSAISIASTEYLGSGTVDASHDDVATDDVLRIDVTSVSTTAPKGLLVTLQFQLP